MLIKDPLGKTNKKQALHLFRFLKKPTSSDQIRKEKNRFSFAAKKKKKTELQVRKIQIRKRSPQSLGVLLRSPGY